ncbi:hypothetical protein STRCR_1149 [Streptococcus criceti HS-6]|uniref:Uncharacterized protein n=1 Tax=Streptococcus criceti HS-6 TaxID=873449 RepID=G5JTQ2_STRCG|nr:hypothetical protein STRCR_1149 [Streptococcus criceti HS-6]
MGTSPQDKDSQPLRQTVITAKNRRLEHFFPSLIYRNLKEIKKEPLSWRYLVS